jgi:hypothetical protein
VTNLTGTASININGTVGGTTPSTGAFSTLSATSGFYLSGAVGFAAGANRLGIDNNAGAARYYAYGANGSTQGSHEFHTIASDGTPDNTVAIISSTGLALTNTITSSAPNDFLANTYATLNAKYINITSTGNTTRIGAESSSAGSSSGTGAAYDSYIWSSTKINLIVGPTKFTNASIARISSTGLEVTGTTSSSGALSASNFSGSSSGTNTGDSASLPIGGGTLTGALTINGTTLTVGNTTSSNINMVDTDEGTRTIHCNSNRIGFLNQAGGWGAYCDDSGNWAANNLSGTNTGDQSTVSGSSGSCTGNSATASTISGYTIQGDQAAPGANQIMRSGSNGYLFTGWINTVSGDNGATAIGRVYASHDGYLRYYTLANFTAQVAANGGSWNGSASTLVAGNNYIINRLTPRASGISLGSGNSSQIEVNNAGSGACNISFHREGAYGAHFGLDTDNWFSTLGWSAGGGYTAMRVGSFLATGSLSVNNGWSYVANNHGYGVVGLYSASVFQLVFAMGDSYKTGAGGAISNLYGAAWSHPNAGGIAGNLDSHGMIVAINGGFGSCMSHSIVASGNVTAYSDERLKTNWAAMPENFVERLAKVRTGTYDRIDGLKLRQVGVSAQSLRPLLPEAVTEATDDFKTLNVSYGNAALASAVELAKEVVSLKEQMTVIMARLNKLENN